MNFDYEELTLMMLYNPGTRLGLIQELRLMQCYLAPDEAALRELSERVIEKLKLLTDAAVRLEVSDNPKRKTKYDLVAVHKQGLGWVNMDSQAPNKVVGEWLSKQEFDLVRPEFAYGKSRIDFYMEKGEQKYLLEVKGCTLEVDGIGYFPDAPTERGVKHLHELAQAQRTGYQCAVAFVIQMEGITEVRPNVSTQPEFGTALAEAKAAGVQVLFLLCHVGRDSLEIVEQREG